MSQDWADKIAQQLLSRGLVQRGVCLILGAADTGKTTLAAALAKHTASRQAVGIVDADIGQSHIGPPTTVGWAVVDTPQVGFSQLTCGGISFVGDVTPVGHLLQLTAAIVRCVQQVSEAAELIIIDTPGLISGPAATALWWTVQRILQPGLILAVQRSNELENILAGLRSFDLRLELVESPPQIPFKSPQRRRNYRQSQFRKYFQDSNVYDISLNKVAVQPGRNLGCESLIHRVVALRDAGGADIAVGIIMDWQDDRGIAVVKAPQLDIGQIRCLVIGDVSIDIAAAPSENH
ncbi:MAG: Clp1/GlmU family protein [Planctomycetota bacterium]|jgi:polynucleotide 5'-hydroxyl-kinase GRC3/NOL9